MNYQNPYFSQSNIGNQNQNSTPQSAAAPVMPSFGQSQFQTQPLFPQPSGNVYNINNTLEVANVPAGIGLSVALCLPENLMYIKTMQNGTPMFWAYRIAPFDNKGEKEERNEQNPAPIVSQVNEESINKINNLESKIASLEKQIEAIKKGSGTTQGTNTGADDKWF